MNEFISTNFKNDRGIKNTGKKFVCGDRCFLKVDFKEISSLAINKQLNKSLKYITLNISDSDLNKQTVLYNVGLDCNGKKTTKTQKFILKSINISVPSIHKNNSEALGEVIFTLQADSCKEGQQNLYICSLLKAGNDNGSVQCSLFKEITKCLRNNSNKETKLTCTSSTCDSFDPRDLLPSDNKNFSTYVDNNPELNLAYCVILFNKLITVSPDFFEYFKNNLYTLSEYNTLIRNPVRDINNDLYISKASIPGESSYPNSDNYKSGVHGIWACRGE